jgi:hypothetical protein
MPGSSGVMLKASEISSLFPHGHQGRRKEGNRGITFRVAVRGDTAHLREILQECLQHGEEAVIDERNPVNGRTILHEACAFGHIDMVKMLLKEFDADAGKKTFMGKTTALHIAASEGHRKIVFYLLVGGADVHATDKYGATPLHNAKRVDVAKTLVQYGALCNVRDRKGRSPVVVVLGLEGDHSKLVYYLEKAGEEQERVEFEMKLEQLKEERLERKLLEEAKERVSVAPPSQSTPAEPSLQKRKVKKVDAQEGRNGLQFWYLHTFCCLQLTLLHILSPPFQGYCGGE